MLDFIHTFLARTPTLLWGTLLFVFVGLEIVSRRPIPWAARRANLANAMVVSLTVFAVAPILGLVFAGVNDLPWRRDWAVELDAGYPGASVLGVVAFMALYDLGYYAFHRAQHSQPWLWRFHAVHHSETRMNATTYVRQHFLENVFQSVAILVPLILVIKVSATTVAWAAGIIALIQFFVHADLPVHYGRFSSALISPLLHRVHHSSDERQSHSNFASLFPAWDVVFGTYHGPTKVEHTGLHDGRRIDGVAGLVFSPFLYQGEAPRRTEAIKLPSTRLQDSSLMKSKSHESRVS